MDTGKAVAALLTNPGDPLDYLEVVGRSLPLKERPAPFIAVPTTAGTGSEVTRNAVLAVPEKQTKVSLRSPMMLARVALVDPELTYDLPPAVTASTGMDALAQVIEPYVSRRANPLVDLYCREGLARAAHSLLRAYQHGSDPAAREDMAYASLMGGLALANAGLGAVHGFAGPVGGMFHAPHGAVCAALLTPVVMINARALAEREPGNPALARYTEIARLVTGNPSADVAALSHGLDELRDALHIPALREYGITHANLDELVEKSANASSMKANPLTLTREEMKEILEMAI
jgi:alcohol dehydrogenase class IV